LKQVQVLQERSVSDMKKRLLVFTLILSVLMIVSSVSCVFADDSARESYGYTVKVYAGEQGTFTDSKLGVISSDGKIITINDVTPGSSLTINEGTTGLKLNKGSEYYVRGFRIAGHDNDELVANIPAVNADASYEVSYGLKGNMVKYTIMYLDENGDELQASNEYYGMVGDKPVVSYLYIDGYQPNAYNLTKTLVADESQNIFGFSYISNPEGTTVVETADGNNSQAGARNAANGQTAGANAAANDANANAPATIVDLDDNATPQAENAGGTSDIAETDTPKAGISPIAIGGGVAAVAAIAALAAFLIRRRNAEYEDDDEDEDEAYSSDSQHAYSKQE